MDKPEPDSRKTDRMPPLERDGETLTFDPAQAVARTFVVDPQQAEGLAEFCEALGKVIKERKRFTLIIHP